MEKLQTILRQISRIVLQDTQHQEEQRLRGELFNVFEVLHLDTKETRTHSAFIAALLDPKGSHGVKDKFLSAFINTIDCLKKLDFNTKDAQVKVEFHTGFKNENETEGGKIDILISSHNQAIIIENKIYADDQPTQLLRYKNYAKRFSNGHCLLYLTLWGDEASAKSTKNKLNIQEDYFAIGYNNEIIKWLDACIVECIRFPLVRETIFQYQHLLKTLTYQNMDSKFREQILDIMVKPENVETFAVIASLFSEWQEYIIKNYLIKQLRESAPKLKLLFDEDLLNEDGSLNREKYVGMWFYRKNWENASIRIEADCSNWRKFYIGICNRKDDSLNVTQKQIFSRGPNNSWPYGWQYLDKYSCWTDDIMDDIVKGKVTEYIIDKVRFVLDEIKKQKLPMP